MNYELALELKNAGFPQGSGHYIDDSGASSLYIDSHFAPKGSVFSPTLEGLIEACGEDLKCVRNFRREMWAHHGKTEGDRQWKSVWGGDEWVVEAVSTYTGDEGTTGAISCNGTTPTEAVALLWITLNKKV